MAAISIHVDDDVQINPMTQQAIDGKWPISIAVTSYVGDGESRHVYQRDSINLHGDVASLRAFANAILEALPEDEAANDRKWREVEESAEYHRAKRRGDDV